MSSSNRYTSPAPTTQVDGNVLEFLRAGLERLKSSQSRHKSQFRTRVGELLYLHYSSLLLSLSGIEYNTQLWLLNVALTDPMAKRTRVTVKILEGQNLPVSDLLTGTSDPVALLWVGSCDEAEVDLKYDKRVQVPSTTSCF